MIHVIRLTDEWGNAAYSEAAPLSLLSIDDRPDYTEKLVNMLTEWFHDGRRTHFNHPEFPSMQFGMDTALLDLKYGGKRVLFDQTFTNGEPISINGLVWMAEIEDMKEEAFQKLSTGFTCIKFKVGAHDFEEEMQLLRSIRQEFNSDRVEIRLDANGAFWMKEALTKLERLAELEIHSIEQPIRPGEWEAMADLCANTPIPIALDEELIGVKGSRRHELLEVINPQYIILKPNLIGGFKAADHWVELAGIYGCGWWATSALESDIGLNAIAQWAASKHPEMPQGLGTGSLFVDNISSPLTVKGETLTYDPERSWDFAGFLEGAECILDLTHR